MPTPDPGRRRRRPAGDRRRPRPRRPPRGRAGPPCPAAHPGRYPALLGGEPGRGCPKPRPRPPRQPGQDDPPGRAGRPPGSAGGRARPGLLEAERVDVTLPAGFHQGGDPPDRPDHRRDRRHLHRPRLPVAEGPEVETDWYNFQAHPPDHPARSMVQPLPRGGRRARGGRAGAAHPDPAGPSRPCKAGPPPVYIVAPGRCHWPTPRRHPRAGVQPGRGPGRGPRPDHGRQGSGGTSAWPSPAPTSARSEIRPRPSYFPFVEPGAEVDVSCFICGGTGEGRRPAAARAGSSQLGAGMVHPNVLRAGGYDPEEVSGFAAGTGIERPYMLRSGLADMRTWTDNDVRWLTSV